MPEWYLWGFVFRLENSPQFVYYLVPLPWILPTLASLVLDYYQKHGFTTRLEHILHLKYLPFSRSFVVGIPQSFFFSGEKFCQLDRIFAFICWELKKGNLSGIIRIWWEKYALYFGCFCFLALIFALDVSEFDILLF